MRYFVRRPTGSPDYVFRILLYVSVEIYDVGAHAWRPRLLEPLYRWVVIDGEIGVDEIPAAEAERIIADREFGPGAGRRRWSDPVQHSARPMPQ
jgi:hypothetical protein